MLVLVWLTHYLPAMPSFWGGRERISVHKAPGAELCMALIPCQEATGLVLMCVVICMSNQNEMQTNLPAGLNLPLSCYLFRFGNSTFFQLQGWRQGCRKGQLCCLLMGRALITSSLELARMQWRRQGGRSKARAACLPLLWPAKRHLALHPCDGIVLVCIVADTQT